MSQTTAHLDPATGQIWLHQPDAPYPWALAVPGGMRRSDQWATDQGMVRLVPEGERGTSRAAEQHDGDKPGLDGYPHVIPPELENTEAEDRAKQFAVGTVTTYGDGHVRVTIFPTRHLAEVDVPSHGSRRLTYGYYRNISPGAPGRWYSRGNGSPVDPSAVLRRISTAIDGPVPAELERWVTS